MDAVVRRHCMRCGRLGIQREQDGYEIWDCPVKHGEIFRALLPPAPEPEKPAKASAQASAPPAPPPPDEDEDDDGKKKELEPAGAQQPPGQQQ